MQKARALLKERGLNAPKGATLRDAFKIWCTVKKGRIASYYEEKSRLENHILPSLGSLQLDEVTAPVVIQCLRPLQRRGHLATLKRVAMRLREILDLAVCAGLIHANPLSRVSRVFPSPKVSPMPSIRWQELDTALETLKDWAPQTRVLFLWQLSSMLRPSEAISVRKDWLDGDTLTIPADEMKMKRPFKVPLTSLHLYVLECAKALSPRPRSPFLFSSNRSSRPRSSQTLSKALNKTPLNGRLVAHGLRSMARTFLADQGVPFEVAEACLAHLTGTAVSRAYLRSDYLPQRREAMTLWCDYIFVCASRAGFLKDFPIDPSHWEGFSNDFVQC